MFCHAHPLAVLHKMTLSTLCLSLTFALFFITGIYHNSTVHTCMFMIILLGVLQACKVGDGYSSESVASNIGVKWYLNVAIPAVCSGSINSYNVMFYDDNLAGNRKYDITLAIWKPINSTTYTIVSFMIYYHDA